MKKKEEENLDKYPEQFSIIFNHIAISEQQEFNKIENDEINEIRKAALNINEPEYTYTTSASGYTPIFRVN